MIGPLLCGAMLILSLMRVAVPFGQRMTGDVIGVVPLGYRERLRLQRINVYLLGAALLLGTVGGWLRAPLNVLVMLAMFVILSIPVQYIFTTTGVARNRVVFRQWSEFDGYEEQTAQIVLRGTKGAGRFVLLLAPDQHADVVRLLARTLPDAASQPLASPAPTRGKSKRGRTAAA